jgi:cadmium resistance protein CadD (predicted permease)
MLEYIAVGAVVFASTNVDDILLLSAFFAQPGRSIARIVFGQFLGIGVLVLVSVVAALAALAIPPDWVAFIGGVPIALGLKYLLARQDTGTTAQAQAGVGSLTVAAVTIANGGDNLGVYIPLFASQPAAVALYVAIFAAGTALWCALGYGLVSHRAVGATIQRYGHRVLPWVLIAIGLHVLSAAFH